MKIIIKIIIVILLLQAPKLLQACYCFCGTQVTQQVIVVDTKQSDNSYNYSSEKTIRVNAKDLHKLHQKTIATTTHDKNCVNKTKLAHVQALRLSTILTDENEFLYENKEYSKIEEHVQKRIQSTGIPVNTQAVTDAMKDPRVIAQWYGIYSQDNNDLPKYTQQQMHKIQQRHQHHKVKKNN